MRIDLRKLTRWIPSLGWLSGYRREDISGDVSAGMTVAVMLIPQGMAYAMLAGLPPIYGLYASVLPLVVYALLGTSRQLAVGPVAMVSLLVASGVGALAPVGSPTFLAYAVLLALMVGVLQFAMGVIRLGVLVNFLSHPVISGFTSAAALIIGLSQLKHLLGVSLPRSHHVHELLLSAASRLGEVHLLTVVMGIVSVVALVLLKRWKPGFPGALVVVVGSAVLVWALRLDQQGVSIVGAVPSGFPPFAVPTIEWAAMKQLLPTALVISLVGFMESIAVARSFATKNGYEVDANQELVALGAANILGAYSMSYPVTGGFSRTAVNAQAGARTGLASLLTALLIAVSLLCLTPLFHFIPKVALAALIVVAVSGLVDWREFVHLWQVNRSDAWLLVLTFGVTLGVGIEIGIAAGVLGSIAVVLFRSFRPHLAVLGYLPKQDVFRNVKHFPEAECRDDVRILRIDASFYFANAAFVKEQILQLATHPSDQELSAIVLDASGVGGLDSSAVHALSEATRALEERGIALYIAGAIGPVRDVLSKAGLDREIGIEHMCMSIKACLAHLDRGPSGLPS